MKDIIIMWMQWAWKWTQAKLLIEKFWEKYSYFETWKVFRTLTSSDNAIWDYVKSKIEIWQIVKSSITEKVFDIFCDIVLEEWKNMLLDGYPRTKSQMDTIKKFIDSNNREMVCVYIDLSEDIAIERMLERWRSDDTEEAIKYRIQQFYDKTKPILDMIKWDFEILNVNWDQSIENVNAEIIKKLWL